jgi:hypothetical protein
MFTMFADWMLFCHIPIGVVCSYLTAFVSMMVAIAFITGQSDRLYQRLVILQFVVFFTRTSCIPVCLLCLVLLDLCCPLLILLFHFIFVFVTADVLCIGSLAVRASSARTLHSTASQCSSSSTPVHLRSVSVDDSLKPDAPLMSCIFSRPAAHELR